MRILESQTGGRLRERALGAIAWLWTLGIAALYLESYPLRLDYWARLAEGWTGPWRFPAAALGALAFVALCAAIAWGVGRAAGRALGLWRGEAGEDCAAALLGFAVMGTGILALGAAGAMRPAALIVWLAALAPVAALGLLDARRRWRWRGWPENAEETAADSCPGAPCSWRDAPDALDARRSGPARFAAGITCAALGVSLFGALGPEIQSDALRYHFYAPQEYLRAGKILYLPHSAFTNFPFLVEMLFTLGLGLANDTAAKLFHWIHLPLAAGLVAALARRLTGRAGRGGAAAAWFAAALFLSTPVAAITAGWGFVDLATTAYLLALVWALDRWLRGGARRRADLIAAGFFAGAAVATKYTCLAPAALAGGVALLAPARVERPARARLGRFAAFALAGAVFAAPWFVKNVVLTGNPVYPLAWGVFGGGDWSADSAAGYKAKTLEKGAARGAPWDHVFAPFDTAFYWPQFESHNPGMGYLLLFPWLAAAGAAAWRRRDGDAVEEEFAPRRAPGTWRVAAGFALFLAVVFFAGYKSNRFLLPVWALAAAMGGALAAGPSAPAPSRISLSDAWAKFAGWRGALAAALLLAALHGGYWSARWLLTEHQPPLAPMVLGFENREAYLRRAISYYPCVLWLRVHAEPGERVFYIGEHRGYPAFAPPTVSDWYDVPWALEWIRRTRDNDELLDALRASGHRYVLFNLEELRLYAAAYFKPRFTPAEWRRFEALVDSPRLRRRWPAQGGVYVSEILPRAAASAASP